MAGNPSTYRDLVEQTQELQRRFALAQADLAETELAGTAGAGLVTVTMRGDGVVTRVAFDPAVFDDGDAESLAALTLAAISQATERVRAVTEEKMAAVSAGLSGTAGLTARH